MFESSLVLLPGRDDSRFARNSSTALPAVFWLFDRKLQSAPQFGNVECQKKKEFKIWNCLDFYLFYIILLSLCCSEMLGRIVGSAETRCREVYITYFISRILLVIAVFDGDHYFGLMEEVLFLGFFRGARWDVCDNHVFVAWRNVFRAKEFNLAYSCGQLFAEIQPLQLVSLSSDNQRWTLIMDYWTSLSRILVSHPILWRYCTHYLQLCFTFESNYKYAKSGPVSGTFCELSLFPDQPSRFIFLRTILQPI